MLWNNIRSIILNLGKKTIISSSGTHFWWKGMDIDKGSNVTGFSIKLKGTFGSWSSGLTSEVAPYPCSGLF